MLTVKVELNSAITRKTTELGRLHIANVGGTRTRGDYAGLAHRKGAEPQFWEDGPTVIRRGRVEGYGRLAEPVWELVSSMLQDMGYRGGRGATALPPNDPYVTRLREALSLALSRLIRAERRTAAPSVTPSWPWPRSSRATCPTRSYASYARSSESPSQTRR
ncbi:hypothetical protein ELZ20_15410 [Brucella abortus]|nr:hypothetical protein ELZ20_15410 [Brucella abortus]